MVSEKEIENTILEKFAEVASSIGYSPLHGKIIGVLIVRGKPMSLQEVAKATGYSSSMISLSLDLLELLGIIKKIKKTGDRKLYIQFQGDLLDALKNAILMRVEKSIASTLGEFEDAKSQLTKLNPKARARTSQTLSTLEGEIKRLDKYVSLLSKLNFPK